MKIRASVGIVTILAASLAAPFAYPRTASAAAPTAAIVTPTNAIAQTFPNILPGSSIAVGDIDLDGQNEIVVGSPPGPSTSVAVYEQDGTLVRSFPVFASTIRAGVSVAVGDVTGGPDIEIVAAARRGVGPQVLLFSAEGRKLSPGFYAYARTFIGGVNLAVGDVNGDGREDIVTTPFPGGGPHVSYFSAAGTRLGNVFPYELEFRGGLSIDTFDYDGDGVEEIVSVPLSRRVADVKVFRATTREVLRTFRAFGGFTGGASVAVNRFRSPATLLLGAGAGGGAQVLEYDPATGTISGINAFPLGKSWRGGITATPVTLGADLTLRYLASGGSVALSADQLAGYVATVNSSYEVRSIPTRSGTLSVKIVKVDLTNPRLRVRTLTATTGDCTDNCPVRSLQSYVDQVGGFAAINGSYFCPADYAGCASSDGSYYWMWYNSLSGTFINSYQNQFNSGGGLVAFDDSNRAYFYRYANGWPGKTGGKALFEEQYGVKLRGLLSNGPTLVFNRQLVVTAGELDSKQATVHSNRSGIGFKGSTAYLVVASGATVLDLGDAMQWLGLDYALNLDGGGSSALWYGGYKAGPGRNIPNAVVFTEN